MIVHGRDAVKTRRVRNEMAAATGNDSVHTVVADLAVARVGARRRGRAARPVRPTRRRDPQRRRPQRRSANDSTTASRRRSPCRSSPRSSSLPLLLERLRAGATGARADDVVRVACTPRRSPSPAWRWPPADYRGTDQYATGQAGPGHAQRAVGRRCRSLGDVVFHAVHPGWADTPGVESSLPRFHRLVGPLLRTPDARRRHDRLARRRRRPSRSRRPAASGTTGGAARSTASAEPGAATPPNDERPLWAWCVERSGVDPALP